MGDLESHDSTCRRLARTADVVVLAVDYRLAPEHPGPAAVEDAVSAYDWVAKHLADLGGDLAAGVALAGDSSGGAVALLAAVRLRDAGRLPSALLLAYPNVDMTLAQPSVDQQGHGWGLEAEDLGSDAIRERADQAPTMQQYAKLWTGGLPDAQGWLGRHGWRTQLDDRASVSATYGRAPAGSSSGGFITATRPG